MLVSFLKEVDLPMIIRYNPKAESAEIDRLISAYAVTVAASRYDDGTDSFTTEINASFSKFF
jgi:hypothetical protein